MGPTFIVGVPAYYFVPGQFVAESCAQKDMKKLCQFPKQDNSGASYAVGCNLVEGTIDSYG